MDVNGPQRRSTDHASTGELTSSDIVLPSVWTPLVVVAGTAGCLFFAGVLWKYFHPSVVGALDWYDVLTKAGQLVLLCSGLGSFLLVRRQMVAQQKTNLQTREKEAKEFQYNRVEAFYRYFGEDNGKDVQAAFVKFVDEAQIAAHWEGEGTAVTDDLKIAEIFAKGDWDSALRNYLDGHEGLAAAVNSGFVDNDMAYCLQASRIIRSVKVLRALIVRIQIAGSPLAYCELLKLDADWQLQRHKDSELQRAEEIQRRSEQERSQMKKLPR